MSSDAPTTGGDAADAGDESLIPVDATWLYMAFYVAVGLWLVYLLTSMGGWRWEDVAVPYIAGIPGLLFVLVYLFRLRYPERYARLNPAVRQLDEEEDDEDLEGLLDEFGEATEQEIERPTRERQRLELVMIAWVIALPVVIQWFGIFIALPIYVFAFAAYFTRDLKRSVAIAVVFTLFVYVFFVLVLGAKVYTGDLGIRPPLPRFRLF